MTKIKDFKDLRIWQQGIDIVKEIYSTTGMFPESEKFGIVNQMRRASVSIPSNISEGHIKNQTKDFIRYLSIALGSCAELETQLTIAREFNWIDEERFQFLVDLIHSEIKQINTLKRNLSES
ncbi:four helix bundle protein [bacterium]|nr:four helix bundle protein [bacterium]